MKITILLLILSLFLSLFLFFTLFLRREEKEKDRHSPLFARIKTVLGPLIVIALDIYCSRDNTVLSPYFVGPSWVYPPCLLSKAEEEEKEEKGTG